MMATNRLTEDEREGAHIATFIPGGSYDADYQSEEEKDWSAFTDEMGDAIDYAKITAYRVPTNASGLPARRKMAFLFECGLNEFSFSQLCSKIQHEFGTGVYRIQARDKGGTILKSKTIEIEAPKGADEKETAGGMVNQIAGAMREQSRQIEEMLTRNRIPGFDFKEVLGYIVPVATALAALGINFKREPQKSLADSLTELKLFKELLSDNGPEPVDNFWGAIAETMKSFGGPLMQAVAHAQQSGQIGANGVLQTPALAAPQSEENKTMDIEKIKPQLEFLLLQAKAQVAPATVAGFVMNSLPDNGEAHEALDDFLGRETAIAECAEILPEIGAHFAWFREWRMAMLAELDLFFGDDDTDENPVNTTTANAPLTMPADKPDNPVVDAGEATVKKRSDDSVAQPARHPGAIDGNPERSARHKSNA